MSENTKVNLFIVCSLLIICLLDEHGMTKKTRINSNYSLYEIPFAYHSPAIQWKKKYSKAIGHCKGGFLGTFL